MSTTSEKFVRDLLLKGRNVDFVADASGFPREHVVRVLQQLREERAAKTAPSPADVPQRTEAAENSGTTPGQSEDKARNDVTDSDEGLPTQLGKLPNPEVTQSDGFPESVSDETDAPSLPEMRERARAAVRPRPEFNARTTNAVELLVRAADMDDRRVQAALGRARKAMTDLAAQVTRYDEQNGACERLAELEEEIRAIRAQMRGGRKTETKKQVTGEFACRKGCGRVSPNPQGRAAHERFCTAEVVADHSEDAPVEATA